ncbi:unnamed protein product [Caenorhabditis angaria]|uniref:7TM GPCR serpentine receptor class x (Srx) domain-containing protein n=1 Tax=Caenorhabditis angaria TaxID=860376 RepID=A0A9P1J052_9PELO|nr:unnamed protein product [Caenorhabditis angaria]
MFIIGALGCGSWLGGCLSCVTLAVNRCCDLNPNFKLRWIFQERRIYWIILLIISYAIYGFLFTNPPLFQCDYFSWFFNPRINNNPHLYINVLHTANNCLVSIFITSFYCYLCLLLNQKSRFSLSSGINKTQRQIFLQSTIICSLNAIAAYIHVYMQYFHTPPIAILIGHIT